MLVIIIIYKIVPFQEGVWEALLRIGICPSSVIVRNIYIGLIEWSFTLIDLEHLNISADEQTTLKREKRRSRERNNKKARIERTEKE